MQRRTNRPRIAAAFLAAALAACGGGGDTTVGGTVSGLEDGAAVSLQLNDGETIVVRENGAFQFEDEILAGARYDVAVVGQPAGASCTVANGSGRIGESATQVQDVTVVCIRAFAIGGTVSGLTEDGSVQLQNNAGDTITISEDRTFRFPTRLPEGSAYEVTVSEQPVDVTCTVEAGTGIVPAQDVTTVDVTCG
jgi:hypothetical protein